MLSALKEIAYSVAQQPDLTLALKEFVSGIKHAMSTQCCSVYFADEAHADFVLMATDGLNQSAVGRFRIGQNEGLVGLVAKREEVLNLPMAQKHPSFKHAPEVKEDTYNAFLAVPIIHHRKVLGVIVVQQKAARVFNQDEESFLVTLSAQIAGQLAHAGAKHILHQAEIAHQTTRLHGIASAPGVAIGKALVIAPSVDLTQIELAKVPDAQSQIRLFHHAVISTRKEFRALAKKIDSGLDTQTVAIFTVYEQLLEAKSLGDQVEAKIKLGWCAKSALKLVIEQLVEQFMAMQDSYIRERASDIQEIGTRVLHHMLANERRQVEVHEPVVLIAQTVTPTVLAEVPKELLVGVVSLTGGASSHASIITRAMGLPALWGVDDLALSEVVGKQIVLDAYTNTLIISPTKLLLNEYKTLLKNENLLKSKFLQEYDEPCITLDGEKVNLLSNEGLGAADDSIGGKSTEGVGLYRTEAWFMQHTQFPSLQLQTQWYKKLLKWYAPLPVTMRTLDIGGDKALSYFNFSEENPFLGWRGIRISLDHPELFLDQIKAMLWANCGLGNLRIMLPMVSDVEEVIEAKRLISQAYDELVAEHSMPSLEYPCIGIMIEVPSSVYLISEWAKHVDFCSIGSNDLTQYLLAVDRTNSRVASLFDSYHPAVLRALHDIAQQCVAVELNFSLCGELAADPEGALLLIAMGYRNLSMSVASIGRVKYVLRRLKTADMERLLADCLMAATANQVHQHLHQFILSQNLSEILYSHFQRSHQ